jgi:hypothetical protein
MIIHLQLTPPPPWIKKHIDKVRADHLEQDGDPADFTAYLADNGVTMSGYAMVIDDDTVLAAKLAYT